MIGVDPIAAISALASFVLAGVLLRQALRLGRAEAPRTVLALAGFLVLSGSAWLVGPMIGHRFHVVQILNGAMTVALVLLALRARSIVEALIDARQDAHLERMEYERALRDYERLMAHRIANPLTVISGAAETMRGVDLPARVRDQLLGLIVEAAQRLERTSSHTDVVSVEERVLRPVPGYAQQDRITGGER